MSHELEGLDLDNLTRGHVTYLPVVPGRLEFAIEVRRRILRLRPSVVAVELPMSLERHYLAAVDRLPEISVLVYPDEDAGDEEDSKGSYVPVEPADPFTEAVRTAREIEADILFVEPDLGERPHISDAYPDTYSLRRMPFDRYVEAYRVYPPARTDEIAAHASGIAWRLQGTNPELTVLAVVSLNLLDPILDAMEIPQSAPANRTLPRPVDLVNAHPDCLAEITVEYPYLQERYERYRTILGPDELIERPRAQLALLRDAEAAYVKNTGDSILHWQRRAIAKYTRNLAMISRELTAGIFDIVVAARGIVDDNYAWEVWEMANRYPAQREVSALETARISSDDGSGVGVVLRIARRRPSGPTRCRGGRARCPPTRSPAHLRRGVAEWCRRARRPTGGRCPRRRRLRGRDPRRRHRAGGLGRNPVARRQEARRSSGRAVDQATRGSRVRRDRRRRRLSDRRPNTGRWLRA